MFLHLEIGNAVAQQSSDAVGFFKYRNRMTCARKLLRGGESGWTRPDYGDALAGLRGRRFRTDPAFYKSSVDDRALDCLDGNRLLVDPQDACSLARRWAHPTSEFGEIVGCMQKPR